MSDLRELAAPVVARAFAAGLTMKDVLAKAEVGRATWWRIRKGKDFQASTLTRIDRAITDLIAEREQTNG